jgi:Protein of unknown function (DUF4239)
VSLVQILLYYVPTPVLGLAIVTAYVVLSIAGLVMIGRFFPARQFKSHNDIAGPLFTTLGTIYAVSLAFMVIVTWQSFDGSSKNAAREANYLADLYRDSAPLPSGFRRAVKAELKEYATAIIDDEWPAMARGEPRSQKAEAAQQKLWNLYAGFEPRSETQTIFFNESVRKLNEASELRRQRLLDARSGLNGLLYFILIAGGLITIFFALFFGTDNFGPQLLMTSLLAALIGLALFTIMSLDFPFTGAVSIKPEVFQTVLAALLNS